SATEPPMAAGTLAARPVAVLVTAGTAPLVIVPAAPVTSWTVLAMAALVPDEALAVAAGSLAVAAGWLAGGALAAGVLDAGVLAVGALGAGALAGGALGAGVLWGEGLALAAEAPVPLAFA